MLEGSAAEQQATQQRTQFMDKYGTKFSGDEGLGVAILAELGRRGIDTGAADEAVQDILDQIRAEATAILDKIKMDERTVSDLMDKVATVEESVAAATGATPGADTAIGTPPPPIDLGGAPAMDMGMGGAPPIEGGAMPPVEGGPPTDAAGAMAAPPSMEGGDMGGLPPIPAEAGAAGTGAPMPTPPPETSPTLSDERVKRVRAAVSARQATPKTFKPSAGVLSAVRSSM
jgi:hypothetical protein